MSKCDLHLVRCMIGCLFEARDIVDDFDMDNELTQYHQRVVYEYKWMNTAQFKQLVRDIARKYTVSTKCNHATEI